MELKASSLLNDASLVSYYRFEGNSNDSKGSFNGTDTAITYSSANGKFGQGAGLNGTNSKIVFSTDSSLNVGGAFTLSLWVYPTAYPASAYNVINKLTYATSGWMLYADINHLWNFFCYGLTPISVTIGDAYSLNTWQNIVATYNGNALSIYLNGELKDSKSTTGTPSVSTNALEIGRYDVLYFPGKVDDVAIFSRALNQSEVSNLYNESSGFFNFF